MKITALRFLTTALFFLIFSLTGYAYGGDVLYASSPVNIFLDNTHTKAIGTAEIGAKVYQIKKTGQWVEVKIKGWRQKGLKSIIYAFMGKRILKVQLTPVGEKFVNVLKTIKDKDTQLTWYEVEISNVWINSKYLADSMDSVWQSVSKLFHERCSMCHALPKSTTFTANQWPATLRVMTRRAALDKEQADVVSKFLQYHAKDTKNLKED